MVQLHEIDKRDLENKLEKKLIFGLKLLVTFLIITDEFYKH